ncbi:hypothetical protein A8708_28900 [Paenibacillus oryzisoli]|uniref:Glycosyl hydrolases family 2 sugar binding domain-containing protein n=2 Tax=Paenibacillus oryzisoli TaxID=1850517 RepID=A0A198A985_9BACL|nr:hypothetical protein A8708_28900 [Paenibacillus oryzisoli]
MELISLNISNLKKMFEQPPVEYKGVPFWSWNDTLEQDELDTQVKGFKEQGMGGFMMHVREGLETPYLSHEFMERIKQTVETAKQESMHAWLYDEDRYSSGMGGGLVPKMGGDEVRAKALTLEVDVEFLYSESIVAVYMAEVQGNEVIHFEQIGPTLAEPLPHGNVYLVFRREIAIANEWCHGDSYTDNLNPKTVELFIQSTYEAYKDAVGSEFGKTIPGIFTDEPSIRGFGQNRSAYAWTPWTDLFPTYFKEKCGYELWSVLPYLFFTGEKSAKTRHDYWRTMTQLFTDSYTKQLGDWCKENGIQFSGHYHSEGNLVSSVQTTGAVMPHYRYMDIPGIDTLCEQTDESLTIKQVASVANQYGKKRVITETYGVTGWELTFEGRKWMGDWQFVLGINYLTHHLALYSLKGCRKRDYPPSFNYNTNWWEYNHILEDYYSKLSAVLSQGKVVRDVLIVHPVSTVWAMLGIDVNGRWGNSAGNHDELQAFNRQFNEFIDLMLAAHYDYDLGDETILQETGQIIDGKFHVNKAAYEVVVLPSMVNIFGSTVDLIRQFIDAGGKVVAVGSLPNLVDGNISDEVLQLSGHPNFILVDEAGAVPFELEKILDRKVSIRDRKMREADTFLYMQRQMDDGQVVFVVNKDRTNEHVVEIQLVGYGDVEIWDLLSGDISRVETQSVDGGVCFKQTFGPTDSKLYVMNNAIKPVEVVRTNNWMFNPPQEQKVEIVTALGPVSLFSRTAPNVLVLDKCRYQIETGDWSAVTDVWQAQRDIRSTLGMRQVYFNGGLQRHLWIHQSHENDHSRITFEFTIHVSDVPEKEVYLVAEQAQRFEVSLNGQKVDDGVTGWYLDRCMGTIKLPTLVNGLNTLLLTCSYTHEMEMEDCFLIGEFALGSDRQIIKEPELLRFGDWCLQGYLHYCGSMIYHLKYEHSESKDCRMIMELGDFAAVTIVVRVNGNEVGHIPWRSAKNIDVTDFLKQGQNSIDIEVVGSPRNMLGPLHQAGTAYDWKEWWDYRRTGQEYTPEYVTVPYGLMSQIHMYKKL